MAHDVATQVRGYMLVFGALLVLTLATVGVSYLRMHLKGEKPMVYWPLGLTAFLFIGLLVSVLLAEGDHLFGTQFGDAFTRE